MVTWSVTIPGQPPSWNHLYIRRRGTSGLAKAAGVETFQTNVVYLVRSARPSGWRPEGFVRVNYRLFLKRDIDADNILKALNDAIARALGTDDRYFLPCVQSKQIDRLNPRIEIDIANASVL